MTAQDVILIAHLVTIVATAATLVMLPFVVYYHWLTCHNLRRIDEIQAGRPDPGKWPASIQHVRDRMKKRR